MKTPKATKLPSGNWRIQLQIDGKRMSITAETKQEVQEKAKKVYAGYQLEKKSPLTLSKAIDRYIEAKEKVLSPSTVQGYKVIQRNYFKELMPMLLTDIASMDIQRAVSRERAKGKSAKTIKNAHGLISSIMKEFRPEFHFSSKLPQKVPYEIKIPSEDEMQRIWAACSGTKYELPILLASWIGLRMSEIRGLKFTDIVNGRLHIQRAKVAGDKGQAVKGPKTVSGDRWIKLPTEIIMLINERHENNQNGSEYICPEAANTIYRGFIKACNNAGVEPCRFHDLRHFAASESHSLGIPDKYQMKRMGHKTDNMLKNVYQHTIRNKEDEFADKIDEAMSALYKKTKK